MPNLMWSKINHLQLGKIAEMYAQVEFLSHGFEIYDTIVDDRGIDFIARKDNAFFEIQVKAVRNYNYTFIQKSKMRELSDKRLVCYMNFIDNAIPKIYIIPALAWKTPNKVLLDKEYEDLKSPAEWGIQNSKKNESMLDEFLSEKLFEPFACCLSVSDNSDRSE